MKRSLIIVLISVLAYVAKAQPFNNRAEFFLEIPDRGNYTVYVDDQFSGSANGRFRFFDVEPGRNLVTIQSNGKQVFKDYIFLNPGSRNISSFSRNGRLRLLANMPIYRNGQYALDNWNGELYENRHEQGKPGRYYGREMSSSDFGRFLDQVKREPFEDGRQKLIRSALRDNRISVNQLAELLKQFSFDDRKLEVAMDSYESIANPSNFYLLREEFAFLSSKDKFDKFLAGR